MEHNLTEQAIKDIQIVLSWLKNGSEMTPYNSIQRIIEQNALLRGLIDEKNKIIDDARAQKPTAWRPKFDIEGDWSLGEPSIESIEYWHEQGLEIEYAYLRAAPVPAQPAAKHGVAWVHGHEPDGSNYIVSRQSLPIGTELYTHEQPAAVPEAVEFKRVVDLCWRIHAHGELGNGKGTYDAISELRGILSAGVVPEAVAKDASLSGREFDALLILLMCSDPWPVGDDQNENTVKSMATRIAKQYGHDHWVDAYHNHVPTDAALLSAADTEVKNG